MEKTLLLFLGAASLSLAAAAQVRETEEAVYPQAEYDRAALIVMHEPNEELFVGTMHPAAALFMDYFDADRAAEEHRAYQEILRQAGAEVVTVRELLLKGCVDEEGNLPHRGRRCLPRRGRLPAFRYPLLHRLRTAHHPAGHRPAA